MGEPCKIDGKKRVVLPDELMEKKTLRPGDFVVFEWENKNVKLTFIKTVKI